MRNKVHSEIFEPKRYEVIWNCRHYVLLLGNELDI